MFLYPIRQGSLRGQQVDGPKKAKPSLLKGITLAFPETYEVARKPQDGPDTDADERHQVKTVE